MSADQYAEHEAQGLPEFLKDPRGVLARRWRWMLAVFALGVVATVAFALSRPQIYRAQAMILVASQQISEDVVRPTLKDEPLTRFNSIVGEVLSSTNLTALIERHALFPDARKRGASENDLVGLMRDGLEIAPAEQASPSAWETARLYTVAYEAPSAALSAAVANDVADLFQQATVRLRTERGRMVNEFLERELEEAEAELREQNRLISEFKSQYRGELPADQALLLQRLERLQQQRQSLALQIAEVEGRMATLSSTTDENSPEARLASLRGDLAREASIYTDDHPNVKALRRQVAALEAELAAGGGTTAPSRGSLIHAARRTGDELRRQQAAAEVELAELESRLQRIPERQEALSVLEEKSTVLRETYLESMRKLHDAELAQDLDSAQQGERVSVLDRAAVPSGPQRRRLKYLLAGFAASLALGLGVGLLLEIVDPVLLGAGQVESLAGLPVLGSVPRIS